MSLRIQCEILLLLRFVSMSFVDGTQIFHKLYNYYYIYKTTVLINLN